MTQIQVLKLHLFECVFGLNSLFGRVKRPAWLSREFWVQLGIKREVCWLWKKGQATWEECKAPGRICREKVRKAKVQTELNLASVLWFLLSFSCILMLLYLSSPPLNIQAHFHLKTKFMFSLNILLSYCFRQTHIPLFVIWRLSFLQPLVSVEELGDLLQYWM